VVVATASHGAEFWRWQPHPEVWVLLIGLAGLYLFALRGIGPRLVPAGQAVATPAQKRWFGLGMVLLWFAADWPMHDIAEEYLYSVHMFQHMVLTFLIPPVVLLATPEWLARVLVGNGRIGRAFLKLARPIPAAVVFNAVQLLTHWQYVVNASVSNGLLHYLLHTVVVITAFAVWMPVVSPLPEYRVSVPAQCIHLFLTSIVPTVPAAWLALAEGALYEAYDTPERLFGISVTSDQQVAGLIMKLGGGVFLWVVIVTLFFKWSAKQDKGTTARRVVLDERGAMVSVEGPAALTFDDVERVFQSAGPPPREPAP
jgi:putative membrane protein